MGKVIVLTGPSGTGKTTLIRKIMEERDDIRFSVSHTTRDKREGETDGTDYHFVNEQTFSDMIEQGDFVEWANVHSAKYGTAFSEIEKATKGDKHIILDIDVQGALALQERGQNAFYLFISPPSIEALTERLTKRKTDKEDEIKLRLWNAKRELEHVDKFDVVIENSELEKAYQEFREAIIDYIEND